MRFRLLTISILALLLLGGCSGLGGSDDATPSATSPPAAATATLPATATSAPASGEATATAPEQTEPSPTSTPADAEGTAPATPASSVSGQFDEILARVVALRELEPTGPIAPTLISREQLREDLIALQSEEYTEDEARQDTEALWLLRLIDDRNLDIFDIFLDLLGERVLGYYNPDTRELYVVNDEAELSALGEMTVAHEMVHALQHQHFELIEMDEDEIDGDRALAHSAIIEGDAEVTATRYVLDHFDRGQLMDLAAESAAGQTDALNRAPAYIREALYFPYVEGVEFATQVYQLRGSEGLSEALANPPVSSEQILHPEKYLDEGERDEPLTVTMLDLEPVLGEGWVAERSDSLGEFDLRLLLRENGATDADGAAAGWGGAQYTLYRGPDDGQALIGVTAVWDSEADAGEFVAGLGQTFGVDDPTGQVIDDDAGRHSAVVRDGASVTLLTGTDREAVERARQAIAGQPG